MATGGSLSSGGAPAVAVFCGSRSGARRLYLQAARETGRLLAARGVTVVYGGATVGLMGALADACLAAGGRVVGVIPRLLVDLELAHSGVTELHVVETMAERKALMAGLAQGFLALPGAYGTLDEAFEMVTWRQLGLHAGPLVFANVGGYFDGLKAFLDRAEEDGLLSRENRGLAAFEPGVEGAVERLLELIAG
ncbi:MAG: cytokinin riboside 5'-monophosphate phosphoribohydrolase [Tepidiforma sp.]|nr:TIGR00730 family Rossman fold protein [Tepidiforma sp.]GIW18607.1 MAG: cytokinin riboside 5'-monophosphate phosphoribohydrolase [Tepidiforma sp.]